VDSIRKPGETPRREVRGAARSRRRVGTAAVEGARCVERGAQRAKLVDEACCVGRVAQRKPTKLWSIASPHTKTHPNQTTTIRFESLVRAH
jgi:hypothetical protein